MDYETMAASLEASGEYRILRKIRAKKEFSIPDGSSLRRGLFIDVETTGLSFIDDEIIELAMVPFSYGNEGKIFEIFEPYQSFQEPRKAIPAEITAITGINQNMVSGHRFDRELIKNYLAQADILIAHNAAFDRKFMEKLFEQACAKPWACSATQINWRTEGFEGTRLGYLVASAGFFYDRHRALNDCYAAIELLARPLPKSKLTALGVLLENARRPSWRIWASHAPFELKDKLRRRGYRWGSGENGGRRAWFIDVANEIKDLELKYLEDEIYGREPPIHIQRIDAYDRFSKRAE
ncbi:DNA polymerase III subunit epsilon [Methylocystaceae bacterium]|nr:DNA polymerase III subunit epsilon [Methylocystaceae bacterium]